MSDTLMAIIGIFVAAILMFMFPLLEFAQRNDEIAQTTIQVAVSEFVDTVTTNGEITQFDYDRLFHRIYSTGNSFDIQIEAKILDDNPRRATTTRDNSLLGDYKYYSVFTNEILEKINNGEPYQLKNEDYIIVTVKNTNDTLATQLKNVFYRMTGKETYTLGTSVSSMVLNGANKDLGPETKLAEIVRLPISTIDPPTQDEQVKVIYHDNLHDPYNILSVTIQPQSEFTLNKGDSHNIIQSEPTITYQNNYTDTYAFTGWNTRMDGQGVYYYSGNTITNITSDIHLYAQWAIQYPDDPEDPGNEPGNDPGNDQAEGPYYAIRTVDPNTVYGSSSWSVHPGTIDGVENIVESSGPYDTWEEAQQFIDDWWNEHQHI